MKTVLRSFFETILHSQTIDAMIEKNITWSRNDYE